MRIVNDKDNKHWMIEHRHQYDDNRDDNSQQKESWIRRMIWNSI